MAWASLVDRIGLGPTATAGGLALLAGEGLAVGAYLRYSPAQVTDPFLLVFPFVWINVGLWALWRTRPPDATDRWRAAAAILAVAYFGVLAAVGGMFDGTHLAHGHGHGVSVRVAYETLPPGIGPAVIGSAGGLGFNLFPYQLVGYVSLAYLVYVTVLEATGAAISGLLGLFSCVSCTWPVLGTALAAVFGSGSAVYAVAASQSYVLSTAVFLSAVALLRWRPSG